MAYSVKGLTVEESSHENMLLYSFKAARQNSLQKLDLCSINRSAPVWKQHQFQTVQNWPELYWRAMTVWLTAA